MGPVWHNSLASLIHEITIVRFLWNWQLLPPIVVTNDLNSTVFDSIIVVAPKIECIPFDILKTPLETYLSVDKNAESGVFAVASELPSKKIIFSGTGKFQNDWDDVR